ncbi:DUF4148 domain-containing protein [Paraburkholderia sp. ZP32-5]|uniref:DUF4148 domain-containing protein n=1 Tax=Paraburkholderia sp. ZP32-5 TaxID=2883245 RepID=UPI001F2833E4|nr:DUF4148 domain-containing protein [Paraburkholderia sp. ZP32-5]
MKATIKTAIVAFALTAASTSFAQSQSTTITRTQVRAELIQLEQEGYRPGANDVQYPHDIQNAEARIAQQQVATEGKTTSSYGSDTAGNSQAGRSGKAGAGQSPVQKTFTPKESHSVGHFDQIYFGS